MACDYTKITVECSESVTLKDAYYSLSFFLWPHLQLVDNGSDSAENLGLSSLWHIPIVVTKYGIQQWREKVLPYLHNIMYIYTYVQYPLPNHHSVLPL